MLLRALLTYFFSQLINILLFGVLLCQQVDAWWLGLQYLWTASLKSTLCQVGISLAPYFHARVAFLGFAEARFIWMCIGTCWCDGYVTLPQVHNWWVQNLISIIELLLTCPCSYNSSLQCVFLSQSLLFLVGWTWQYMKMCPWLHHWFEDFDGMWLFKYCRACVDLGLWVCWQWRRI